jgi:hypothetical protein
MKNPNAKRSVFGARKDKVGGTARAEKVRREMEEKTAKYYDELSEEEVEEEIAWGKFATAQFAAIEMDREKASGSVPATSKPRDRAQPKRKTKRS